MVTRDTLETSGAMCFLHDMYDYRRTVLTLEFPIYLPCQCLFQASLQGNFTFLIFPRSKRSGECNSDKLTTRHDKTHVPLIASLCGSSTVVSQLFSKTQQNTITRGHIRSSEGPKPSSARASPQIMLLKSSSQMGRGYSSHISLSKIPS